MAIGLLTLVSLAASAYGASQSAKQNRAIDEQIKRRRAELQAWFDKELGTGYLDTTSGKSAIKLLLENMRRQNEGLQNTAAITGASSEAVTGQKERFMENYTNAIAKMLGYDTERKDALRRDYMMQNAGVQDLELQNMAGKSQNWSNFMTNAANLGQAAITSQSMGASEKGQGMTLQDLFGGKNKAVGMAGNQNWLNQNMLNIRNSGLVRTNRNPYILSQMLPMIYGR